jgi:hypothetical protein
MRSITELTVSDSELDITGSCIIVYLFEFANLCLFMFVVVEM